MIKSDAPVMQGWYQLDEVTVTQERRDFLAYKGQRLYDKYCGTGGRGICAESFAEYHLWRGELVVVRDFLAFLDRQIERLTHLEERTPAVDDELHMVRRLTERIQNLLGE